MKQLFRSLTLLLLVLPLFSGCNDNYYPEMTLGNKAWRVVEVVGVSPYQRNDILYFYRNGDFEFRGPGGLNETGIWRVVGHRLELSFDGSRLPVDIEAPMPILDGGYAVLDCYDYGYNSRYTLRIVAEHDLYYDYY
ncbi:MAG: hypothetical protein IJ553_01930 [Alloprevotella sp.]|nr:hypothetical protein [Alloprevotella sp.]